MVDPPQGTPGPPTTVILFGATGDLSRRKLLPGMLHLWRSGLLPHVRVVGTSLDEHTRESFVELAREAIDEFGNDAQDKEEFEEFAKNLFWAPNGRRQPQGRGRRGGGRLRPAALPPALPLGAAEVGAGGGAHAPRRRAGREQPDRHGEAVRHRPGERARR